MGNEHDEHDDSPRARARAHLRRVLQASLVAAAGCVDQTNTETTTSPTHGDTWDDPCAHDGCDPVPTPTTSTATEPADSGPSTTGDTSSSSGTTGGTESGSGTSSSSSSGGGTGLDSSSGTGSGGTSGG